MKLFGRKAQHNLGAAKEMVEQVISDIGLSPDDNRLQTDDNSAAWGLMRGSAQVFIFIRPPEDKEEATTLEVVAPVLRLPASTPSQNSLFRRVLELNASEVAGLAFALREDTLILSTTRTTQDLDRSEVKDMILRVGYFADRYDDALVNQFGGKRYSDSA